MNHQDYTPEEGDQYSEKMSEKAIQQFFAHMERKHKKMIDYMEQEGFIERTEEPGVFKYTPEGLVVIQEQYKKFKNNGY
jgi:hypothetical protein